MQIAILINDSEYREALVKRLSCYDNDLFVDIISGKGPFNKDSLIITDIDPKTLDKKLLSKISRRTVFLSSIISSDRESTDYHQFFKYDSVADILAEASLVYKKWRGAGYGRDHTSKIICACFENDAASADNCMSLARQIFYKRGDKVLVISLSYMNDYGCSDAGGANRFARMMYAISTGRHDAAGGYTYTDSYGISALLLERGNNPLAYLSEEELITVVSSMAAMFDTVILDLGTCYRKENLTMAETSDSIIFFEIGRRSLDMEKMLGKEAASKMIRIRQSGGTEDAMAIDDAICRIYGSDPDESSEN